MGREIGSQRDYERGLLCAAALIFGAAAVDRDLALRIMRNDLGFDTLEDVRQCGPGEDDMGFFRHLFEGR